ncbi:M23 family metallopeptidase [Ancylothrix sp. C2]|nr:M23 family metallopeptidase [Ancylothrix sp. D3o]MCT7952537.1 M23 family metallopeptidase [Ancylothrix sp. D3o]
MNFQKIAMGTLVALVAQDQLQLTFSTTAFAETPPSINNDVALIDNKVVKAVNLPRVEGETGPVFAGEFKNLNLNSQRQEVPQQTNLLKAEPVISLGEGVPVITPSHLLDEQGEMEAAGESWFHDDREPKSINFSPNNQRQFYQVSAETPARVSGEPALIQENSTNQAGQVSARLDALRNQIEMYQQNAGELPPLGSPDIYLPDAPPAKGFIWPASGVLTSGYGMRWGRMHRGIDIAAPIGTPIFAAASGVVTYAGWNKGGYGNLVEIRHPDGSITRYAHNNRILVRKGQQVEQSQQIAEMGSTGFSTGPHSHFEIHSPGRGAVDPIAFLPRESINNRRISQGW